MKNRRLTPEEKKERCLSLIRLFLKRDDVYSFMFLTKSQEITYYNKLDEWLDFAKENLSKEEYEKFYFKNRPLDASVEGGLNEELALQVKDMAINLVEGKATLFDIIDTLTPSLHTYMALVREASFRHNILSKGYFKKNLDYYYKNNKYLYDDPLLTTYGELSESDVNQVINLIKEYKLPINNITFKEAYKHAKLKGLVKTKSIKR